MMQDFFIIIILPFQMYHGPKLQPSAYHVVHPQRRNQKFDSIQDSTFY